MDERSTDPFDYLGFSAGSATDNAVIQGTFASAYHLLLTIGIVGLVVTISFIGIKIAAAPPQKRIEALQELLAKCLIAIALFSVTTIIAVIMQVAEAIAG